MQAKAKTKFTYVGRAKETEYVNLGPGEFIQKAWRGEVVRSDGVVVTHRGPYQKESMAKVQAARAAKPYQRYFDHYGYCFYDEQKDKKERDGKVRKLARNKDAAMRAAAPVLYTALEGLLAAIGPFDARTHTQAQLDARKAAHDAIAKATYTE